jgi:hypothetical protein
MLARPSSDWCSANRRAGGSNVPQEVDRHRGGGIRAGRRHGRDRAGLGHDERLEREEQSRDGAQRPGGAQGPPGSIGGPDGDMHGPGEGAVHSVSVVPDKAGTSFITLTSDRGTVKSVDSAGATITIAEGTKSATYKTLTLTVPSGAKVIRDGKTASLDEIKAEDDVSVSSSSEGTTVFAMDSSFRPEHAPGRGGPPGMGGPPPGQEASGAEAKSGTGTKTGTATTTTE